MPKKLPIFYSALLLTGVNLLLRLVGTSFQVYISGRIGAAGVGLLQLTMSVGSLAMVTGIAGVRTATMYLTAEELGKKRPGNVTWVLSGCFVYSILCSTAVAAVTAAGKTQNLLTVPLESVGTAMATYAGQNLGASRMDRVRKGTNSAMLIILVYGLASAFILHFTDVQIMGLFLDTAKEVDIVAMGRQYLFWNSVFFVPLGALIVWRYTIQGLGFSSLAMLAGVAEMIARTAVAIILVPILGYFGAELANPAAWVAACLFLYPAYRWTCRQLDNRLLAAKLHIQGNHAETVL